MIILKMCFSVNQITDLQCSNKKTFCLPWLKPKLGFIPEMIKKILGGTRSQKSQKEMHNP